MRRRRILGGTRSARRSLGRHWIVLAVLAATAALLYVLPILIKIHEPLQNLLQAVADALVVAIIVSLAVEPRLLRYFGGELKSFGEQLATQTFWSSFYSRAPDTYREAIKELAASDQFSMSSNWIVSFDWANDEKTIIKLSLEHTNYRENRRSTDFPIVTNTFIYKSPFKDYDSQFRYHAIICEALEFYSDLLRDGYSKVTDQADRLQIMSANDAEVPYLAVPPGARFTVLTHAETYLPVTSHFPLSVNVPVLRFTIRLCGDALNDLYISVLLPSGNWAARGKGQDLAARGQILVGGVFITGQAVMLSWGSQSTADN